MRGSWNVEARHLPVRDKDPDDTSLPQSANSSLDKTVHFFGMYTPFTERSTTAQLSGNYIEVEFMSELAKVSKVDWRIVLGIQKRCLAKFLCVRLRQENSAIQFYLWIRSCYKRLKPSIRPNSTLKGSGTLYALLYPRRTSNIFGYWLKGKFRRPHFANMKLSLGECVVTRQ